LLVVVLGVDDPVGIEDSGAGLPPSEPDEQPARTAEQAAVAAVTARIG
jgi:hypothetical protein